MFRQNFANVVNGVLMRNHWEKSVMLTSVVDAKQTDDEICFIRRINYHESLVPPNYEETCISRKFNAI